jgi:hypothetical protein
MPNAIKYNTSTETLALKKGNFWIGTGDVGKGPTSSTGYYNGITPPSGGYTIYLNKETGGPSIYTVTTEAQMVSLTNTIGSQSFTTSGQCLNWFATQTDKMIFNIDYPAVVTNGLILNLDAGFTPSYPTTNTTWYNLSSSGNNGTLINGPTFNSLNGGTIITDAADDTIQVDYNFTQHSTITINFFANSSYNNESMVWSMGGNGPDWYIKADTMGYNSYGADTYGLSTTQINNLGLRNNWRLLTMTYTQNSPVANNKVYVNGVEQSTSQQLGGTNGMSFNNQIYFTSAYGNGAGYCLSATVGYISIYNRALSASEVLQNYNALKGRYGL